MLLVLRRYGGRIFEVNFSDRSAERRSCTRGCRTSISPKPVSSFRLGRWPLRTTCRRPRSSRCSACAWIQSLTSASMAWVNIRCAPSRRIAVRTSRLCGSGSTFTFVVESCMVAYSFALLAAGLKSNKSHPEYAAFFLWPSTTFGYSSFSPHDESGWEIPAFLFRKHNVAFEQLEAFFQGGTDELGRIPGRTGDDCLAFCRDNTGSITKSLYCEAKCTASHDSGMIAKAHVKVGSSSMVSIPQLVEILQRRDSPEAKKWIDALRKYRMRLTLKSAHRLNMVNYVYGGYRHMLLREDPRKWPAVLP